MYLVVLAALAAMCGAAQLDRTYLPPHNPGTPGARGSPASLQAPLTRSSEQERDTPQLPTGSYTNDFGGVVVDAASPGIRATADADLSGLGGPRPSYGSSNSKVGDAAFRGSVAGFRDHPSFGAAQRKVAAHGQSNTGHLHNDAEHGFLSNTNIDNIDTHTTGFAQNGHEGNGQIGVGQFLSNGQSFQSFAENKPERPQAVKDRNSNILALSNDVNTDSYSYGFETDNGITVGENGVAVNGIQAEGGYSYQGDDGQVYKVTYTADEGGYRPQGAHLPTPPPIPDDILKSLQQNAKEEAAGIVDDGSYDAQKYNADGDYTHDNGGNIHYNGAQLSQFGKQPESDATAVGTFNQNSQVFGTGSVEAGSNAQNSHFAFNGQSSQTIGNTGGLLGAATNAQNVYNGQSSQPNGHGNFGDKRLQFNGQETQVNYKPNPAQVGTGSQSSHSSFGHENQFTSGSPNNGDTGSHREHSSQQLSGPHGNLLNGQTSGNQFTTSLSQSQLGSQFSQQAFMSTEYGNNSPNSSSQTSSEGSKAHFNSKPPKSFINKGATGSLLSQPQFGSSFKPQGSEAFSGASLNQDQDTQDYGKPSPQTFSGQNFNRPSAGSYNFNKPTLVQVQNKFGAFTANGFNRFPQTAGQLGNNNEYIPPFISNSQSLSKIESSASGLSLDFSGPSSIEQETGQKKQTSDFVAVNRPSFTSTSASTSSFGQSNFQVQPTKPSNAINMQPQFNQFAQQTSQFSQDPTQINIHSQQPDTFSAQSESDFGSKPTTIPDTELTTPLEPNEVPNSQSSQFISETSFGTFGSNIRHSTSQTLAPNFPIPSSNNNMPSQFETASAHSIEKETENSNAKPDFSKNSLGQIQQNQPSFTQGVDNSYYYNQPTKNYGTSVMRPEGSRFPNSPAYQSNGVASQKQIFNQQGFESSTKFSGPASLAPVGPTSTTQFAQNQSYNGITQAAISPFPSASPTSSSQVGTTLGGLFGAKPSFNQQSTFGNQAEITKNRGSNSYSQQLVSGQLPVSPFSLSQKPKLSESQTQTQFRQPLSESTSGSSDDLSQQVPTQTHQYEGTIYEYNKPAEVLPAPTHTDSSSSQTIQTIATSESKPTLSKSQTNQLPTQQHSNPFNGINENTKLFGSVPSTFQFKQQNQTDYGNINSQQTGFQLGSQPAKPFIVPSSSSSNTQFGQSAQFQSAKPFGASSTSIHSGSITSGSSSLSQQNLQGLQTAQSFKPYGEASQGSQTAFGVSQFSSQTPQLSQTTQSLGNFQHSKAENGLGSQSQLSSQTFQNTASSQDNGYFYPGNPKPQFAERTINQFSPDSQSDKFRSGLNKFNQNLSGSPQTIGISNQQLSQANSASKSQFVAQQQDNQKAQAAFDQTSPDSAIQPFSQPAFGQSVASSQAIASGQATTTVTATASNSPQQYKQFGLQNRNQYDQTQNTGSRDQSGQGYKQFGTQHLKPFGSNTQDSLNSKPFGINTQVSGEASKPVFSSPCCQSSKDSSPAPSTDKFSSASFQGAHGLNTQGMAAKGEQFEGPRQPPRFDAQTGYHY